MKVQLIFLLAVVACSHAATCPQFWHLYRDHCYRYFGKRVTWAQAEESCNEHFGKNGKGRLVSIHDAEENDFVYKLFRDSINDTPVFSGSAGTPIYGLWIGMYQAVRDGPWIYTDGSPADFYQWKANEPSNNYYGLGDEDCVHIWRRNSASDIAKEWNDVICSTVMAFVCKMEMD